MFFKAKSQSDPSSPRRGFFSRRPRERDRLLPLYNGIVALARDPFWYREGRVPDTVDGRFDMLAALMALVLIRFETQGSEEATQDSVLLTELFIEDMDETLHQIGIGDYVVGKHVGKMMGALGGRLSAFREASRTRAFAAPVRRNIYHEEPPSEEVLELVAGRLERLDAALLHASPDDLVAGKLPTP